MAHNNLSAFDVGRIINSFTAPVAATVSQLRKTKRALLEWWSCSVYAGQIAGRNVLLRTILRVLDRCARGARMDDVEQSRERTTLLRPGVYIARLIGVWRGCDQSCCPWRCFLEVFVRGGAQGQKSVL